MLTSTFIATSGDNAERIFMGLLGRLKNKAKGAAKSGAQRIVNKVAKTANIPMNESRTDKDRQEIEALRQEGAPSFRDEGLEEWGTGAEELTRLGIEGLGMLQARWTDSELSAKARLEAFNKEMDGAAGASDRTWAQASDILLRGWQARGEEVALAWTQTFDTLSKAWETAGNGHFDEVYAAGYRGAAGEFDLAWQSAWEGLQAAMQAAGAKMKSSVDDAQGALGSGLPEDLNKAFQKAGNYLEDTILRAEAELWGVWGTNGARIRGVARTATEGRGDGGEIYREVFQRCREDFALGFKHTLSDFETSWGNSLRVLKAGAGRE